MTRYLPLALFLVTSCVVVPSATAEDSWFPWGPRDYQLEDVLITAHWSEHCSRSRFSLQEVTIGGDGTVEITRAGGISYPGDSHRLSGGAVREVISEFYSAGFFQMDSGYPSRFWVYVYDDGRVHPRALSDAFCCNTVITFQAGGYLKTVDSWGGAPSSFDELARVIAEAAVLSHQVEGGQ